jgi:hypothetical protein
MNKMIKMKTIVLALSFLMFSGIASAQAKTEEKPAAAATVPQLTDAEKNSILAAQKKVLVLAVQMQDLEKQYQNLVSQRADASKQLTDALAASQHRIGDQYHIDPDTLAVTLPPAPAPPTPSTSPTDKK